jgi:ABC-2 type transport system permease protein/Cu-processing system permease protein
MRFPLFIMNLLPLPSFFAVARAAAGREFLSHRLNRFLHAHLLLVLAAGFLPLLTPGEALARGAAWWLLHAVLYAVSLSALLLGLSSAQAEAEEFAWLLGQPTGMGAWLAGKAGALVALAIGAAALLIAPAAVAGGASPALALVGAGAAGVSVVGALAGLAIGFWIRDNVRGLIVAVLVWLVALFGTDLAMLALAGAPFAQRHPDLWVAPLMANPLDAFRITVLFAVERAAFGGSGAGRLTGWWVANAPFWLATVLFAWAASSTALAWLGARRRVDN